ncbi:MAG: hypothetical protein SFV18_14095 [Bryobacteraceae bacterium]|nr:hypothetical protein [Bryobacteraceae bacterium]
MKEYLEQRNGGYYFIGSRISLAAIYYPFFRDGAAPETIQSDFSGFLTLEQVYGAITFMLANRDEVERYIAEQSRFDEEMEREAMKKTPLEWLERVAAHRERALAKK